MILGRGNQCIMTKEDIRADGEENTMVHFSLGKERLRLF